jgi:hypothetical protein
MSSVTVEIPDSLKRGIEALATAEGYTLEQFLAADRRILRRQPLFTAC